MNEQAFFEKGQQEWARLLFLCEKADRSPTDLLPTELRELFVLYRRASTDLASARTSSTNPNLIRYLNDIVARAYGVVYREPKRSFFRTLWNAAETAAQTVRRRKGFVLASAALFFGSAILAFSLSLASPAFSAHFIPPGAEGLIDNWKKGQFDEHSDSQSTFMTTFYASHNPQVSIISGAIGAASFGTLSLFMIAENGAMVGVLASQLAPLGKVDFLLSSIAPHGVPELSGIIMAGASGFLLGYALINPGRKTRGGALRSAGRDAVTLLATSVVLTLIAAPIEGFFSFNPHVPGWTKVTVAAISLTAWIVFWCYFGRSSEIESAAIAEDRLTQQPAAPVNA